VSKVSEVAILGRKITSLSRLDRHAVYGSLTGTLIGVGDALAFSVLENIRPMHTPSSPAYQADADGGSSTSLRPGGTSRSRVERLTDGQTETAGRIGVDGFR
jgi:hypothetical protein